MAFSIPNQVFSQYQEVVDELILNDNIGKNCRLTYPELRSDCPNCIYDSVQRKSSNKYQSGGPIPFLSGVCPYCRGTGVLATPQTEVIRLRVYWTKKDFRKLGAVDIPDGDIMVIGFMSDMAKLQKAMEVLIFSDASATINKKFEVSAEIMPWGFGKNKYFVAHLKRKA